MGSYTYNRLKPILKDKYDIKFARVAESGFFLTPKTIHSVLLIHDLSSKKAYLLDPSLHKYGPMENYDEYLYFDVGDTITGVQQKNPDVQFFVDFGTPLLIRNDFISSLSVGSYQGKFDKDNFILTIKANRRYKYAGRYGFAIRKYNGELDVTEDTWLGNEILTKEEIEKLKKTLTSWVENL